jgi:hypothetical protein
MHITKVSKAGHYNIGYAQALASVYNTEITDF